MSIESRVVVNELHLKSKLAETLLHVAMRNFTHVAVAAEVRGRRRLKSWLRHKAGVGSALSSCRGDSLGGWRANRAGKPASEEPEVKSARESSEFEAIAKERLDRLASRCTHVVDPTSTLSTQQLPPSSVDCSSLANSPRGAAPLSVTGESEAVFETEVKLR